MSNKHGTTRPRHIAMIMDGNGRWASQRHLPRFKGHQQGVAALEGIFKAAIQYRVEGLTLYAFSSDNWKRPPAEVSFLMKLLLKYLKTQRTHCIKHGIRINVIGRRDRLPRGMNAAIRMMELTTRNCKKLTVRLAIDYSSKYSLIQAAKLGSLEYALDNDQFSALLEKVNHVNSSLPEIDLLIRTGGEQRLSDFLLWEVAYSEFYFTPVLWPDFDESVFSLALKEFSHRKRRFGALPELSRAL